jgi:hypothetical protein
MQRVQTVPYVIAEATTPLMPVRLSEKEPTIWGKARVRLETIVK